jgi:hypothetical protein
MSSAGKGGLLFSDNGDTRRMCHNNGKLRKGEWEIHTVSLAIATTLVERHHYAGGCANTATYRHGLFKKGTFFDAQCAGVALWIPPTKSAALATYPENWQGVLCLSRLVIIPDAPKNAASFLLAASMRLIDRERWPCLVTYADEWRGHTGAIYRATNWTYQGQTAPEAVYTLDGRMIARKAGPRTRTKAQMLAMGCELVGRFSKHKFVHLLGSDNPATQE